MRSGSRPDGQQMRTKSDSAWASGKTLEAYGKEEIVEIIDMSDFVAEQRKLVGDWSAGKLLTPAEHVYVTRSATAEANVGLKAWSVNRALNADCLKKNYTGLP